MPAVGELVQSTSGQWMVRPPQRCAHGHRQRPGHVLIQGWLGGAEVTEDHITRVFAAVNKILTAGRIEQAREELRGLETAA